MLNEIQTGLKARLTLCQGLYANSISRPSLCWTYTSTAASICQSLGYHRLESNRKEDQIKKDCFWLVYSLDKAYAIKLGRPSSIQDYDITVSQNPPPEDPRELSWYRVNQSYIKFGAIQGKVYDRLYSAAGLRQGAESRSQEAKKLLLELSQWRAESDGVSSLAPGSQNTL